MSKASEWAGAMRKSIEQRDQVSRSRPSAFYFKLAPGRTMDFGMTENGQPLINAPLMPNEPVDLKQLLSLAHWILDTFEDKP